MRQISQLWPAIISAIILTACKDDPQTSIVDEVMACSTGASWAYRPKCRVTLIDGRRITVFAPVASGDEVWLEYSAYEVWEVK